jgi:hypothetical protein
LALIAVCNLFWTVCKVLMLMGRQNKRYPC